jgi:hypothetical protein
MNLATSRSIRLIFAAAFVTLLSVATARASFLLPGYEFAINGSAGQSSGADNSGADKGNAAPWFLNSSSYPGADNRETPSWGVGRWGFGSNAGPQTSGHGGTTGAPFSGSAGLSGSAGHWQPSSASRTFSFGSPTGNPSPRVYAWSDGEVWNRQAVGDFFRRLGWQFSRGGPTGPAIENASLTALRPPSSTVENGSPRNNGGNNGANHPEFNGKGVYWNNSQADDQPVSFGGRLYPETGDPDHAGGQIYRWDDGGWHWCNISWRPEHIVVCRPTCEDHEWWHKRYRDECPEFYIPDRHCDDHHGHHRRCHHQHCSGHHCRYPHWSGGDHCHTVPVPSNLVLSSIGLGCFFLVRTLRGGYRRRKAD